MKYVIWVAIAVAAVYFGRGLLGPSTPKAHEVEQKTLLTLAFTTKV